MAGVRNKEFPRQLAFYLEEGLKEWGLSLSETAQARLLRYLEFLAEFGEPLGLTALKDPKDLVVKHVLDSLALLSYLPNLQAGGQI